MSRPVQQWPEAFAQRYREAGLWTGETFPAWFGTRVAAHPDRLAIVGGGERWTYADLARRAAGVAAGLRRAGLEPGDRVLVQLHNVPAFFAATFGAFVGGFVPVFTLPAHRETELTHFARVAEARAIVTASRIGAMDHAALARRVQEAVPALAHIFAAGLVDEAEGVVSLESLYELPAGPPADVQASDVALMQLSGGSTGLSKLIPRTHDDYIYSFRRSNEICAITPETVYLAVLPVAHNFTMSSPGTFGVLYAGGRVVLSPSPSPDDAFPLLEQEGVTITAVVPPLALAWMDARRRRPVHAPSWQVLQVGGAKLTPEAARRIEPELGVRLQQVFGMAEGLVNYTELDAPYHVRTETQGRPMSPLDEVLIVDDAGNPVPTGVPGHLLTRGPYTIRGYHDDPAANARSFTPDGYYRTGDVVSRDGHGYLTVHGRATDHINRGGEKVSAEEIEDHLLAHPDVHDAAVVAVPDPYLGERACAFIVPRGEAPKATALKAWLRARGIAAFKVPDQIRFVDAFPETGVGKTSRRALRAHLRGVARGDGE